MGYLVEIESPDDVKDIFDNFFNSVFINAEDSAFNHDYRDRVTITTSFKSFSGSLYSRIDELTFKVRVCCDCSLSPIK